MRGCFFIGVTFALALLFSSPVSAELIVNGDLETVTAGTPYDTFDGWTYGWNDKTDGSVMPSTDSVISGNRSVKLGFNAANYHGQINQGVVTGPAWHAELDFAILTDTTRALGVSVFIDAPGSTDGKERIVLKTDAGKLFVAGGPEAVGGWTDLDLSNAFVTSGSVWNGQTPVTNHLTIDGFFDAATPYYTVTLNGETSDPIAYWLNGTGTVVAGSTAKGLELSGAYAGSGGGGDVNNWLADNVSVVEVPEPTSIMLLISSVVLLCLGMHRRR